MGIAEIVIGMGIIFSIFVPLIIWASDNKELEEWRKRGRR